MSSVTVDFPFVCCFHSNEQSTHVKLYLLDIQVSVLQEGESLTHELMDTILVNILEPVKVCCAMRVCARIVQLSPLSLSVQECSIV